MADHGGRMSSKFQTPTRSGATTPTKGGGVPLFTLEELSVGFTGVMKWDTNWVEIPNSAKDAPPERALVRATPVFLLTKENVPSGFSRTFAVRLELPLALPPSFRGTGVRFVYCLTVTARGPTETTPQVLRLPVRVWAHPGNTQPGDVIEFPIQGDAPSINIQWRETSPYDSRWLADSMWGFWGPAPPSESGQSTVTDSELSISLANSRGRNGIALPLTPAPLPRVPSGGLLTPMDRSLSYPNLASVGSTADEDSVSHGGGFAGGNSGGFSGGFGGGGANGDARRDGDALDNSSPPGSPRSPDDGLIGFWEDDSNQATPLPSPHLHPGGPGGTSGRVYNVSIRDQPLLRFALQSPSGVYHLGDSVAGTLDFSQSHAAGARYRCLQVLSTLEMEEVLAREVLHPARRAALAAAPPGGSSSSLSGSSFRKVQDEWMEYTCDTLHTHFIFTLPSDAPSTFATPFVSVRWLLRFEFVAVVVGGSESAVGAKGGGAPPPSTVEAARRAGAQIEHVMWAVPLHVSVPQKKGARDGRQRHAPGIASCPAFMSSASLAAYR
eukprot:jgi/Mesvir1/6900/Mv09060-RA.1